MSEALQMALRGRSCEGVIHHSDQGVQYSSKPFKPCVECMGSSSRWAVSVIVMTMRKPNHGLPH